MFSQTVSCGRSVHLWAVSGSAWTLSVWKCSSESVRAVCDLTSPGPKVNLSGHCSAEPVFCTYYIYLVYHLFQPFTTQYSLWRKSEPYGEKCFCRSLGYFTTPHQLKLVHSFIHSFIHSFCSLSYDNSSTTSSKASSPQCDRTLAQSSSSNLTFPRGNRVAAYVFFLVFFYCIYIYISSYVNSCGTKTRWCGSVNQDFTCAEKCCSTNLLLSELKVFRYGGQLRIHNAQPRTADKGWSTRLGVARGANNSSS